jgi:hypothetical protein
VDDELGRVRERLAALRRASTPPRADVRSDDRLIVKARARAAALQWLEAYGADAPMQIRRWAAHPTTDEEAAVFLRRVARTAAALVRKFRLHDLARCSQRVS